MTNSTQDTARAEANAALTAGIEARLDDLAARVHDPMVTYQENAADVPVLVNAIEYVTDYVERCEESGITMHPADVRRLIASALGVASS